MTTPCCDTTHADSVLTIRRFRRLSEASVGCKREFYGHGCGIPKSLQIFLQSKSLISLWRGTAERALVAGLPHQE